MDRIQAQAAKLWQLLFSSETASTYQKTLTLTWEILKESAFLVWLIVCLVFVLFDWFWQSSVQVGRDLRSWYDGFEDPNANNVLSATGKAVLAAGEAGASYILSQAKEQLGIENTIAPAKQIAAKPVKPAEKPKPAVSASDDLDAE